MGRRPQERGPDQGRDRRSSSGSYAGPTSRHEAKRASAASSFSAAFSNAAMASAALGLGLVVAAGHVGHLLGPVVEVGVGQLGLQLRHLVLGLLPALLGLAQLLPQRLGRPGPLLAALGRGAPVGGPPAAVGADRAAARPRGRGIGLRGEDRLVDAVVPAWPCRRGPR